MHPLTLFEELGIRHFAGPFALNHILEEKRRAYLEEKVGILARSYYGHIENKAFLISGLVQTPSAKKIFETFSRLGVQKSCLYPWVSFSDGETWYGHSFSLVFDIHIIHPPSVYVSIGDFPQDGLVLLADIQARSIFDEQLLPQTPPGDARESFVRDFLDAITQKKIYGYDLHYGYKNGMDKDFHYHNRRRKLYTLIRKELLSLENSLAP